MDLSNVVSVGSFFRSRFLLDDLRGMLNIKVTLGWHESGSCQFREKLSRVTLISLERGENGESVNF